MIRSARGKFCDYESLSQLINLKFDFSVNLVVAMRLMDLAFIIALDHTEHKEGQNVPSFGYSNYLHSIEYLFREILCLLGDNNLYSSIL